MYHGYVWSHILDFICLQVADEMPFNIFGQRFIFLSHFLHFALAEDTLSGSVCFFNRLIGMKLGYGYQADTGWEVGQNFF